MFLSPQSQRLSLHVGQRQVELGCPGRMEVACCSRVSHLPCSLFPRDRKKKRFVGQTGQEEKKKVRTESGRYISSSYKNNLYPAHAVLGELGVGLHGPAAGVTGEGALSGARRRWGGAKGGGRVSDGKCCACP